MKRYFLHLNSRSGTLYDPEGLEFEDASAAAAACLKIIRGLIGADAQQGQIDLAQTIVLTDEQDHVIEQIPFVIALGFEHPADARLASLCPVIGQWGGGGHAHLTDIDHDNSIANPATACRTDNVSHSHN